MHSFMIVMMMMEHNIRYAAAIARMSGLAGALACRAGERRQWGARRTSVYIPSFLSLELRLYHPPLLFCIDFSSSD